MPRRLIEFNPGGAYHLYNRGVNRQKVFFDSVNYRLFLNRVDRYLRPVMDITAYCLMPNHYHLLVFIRETSEVSNAMMRLSVSYTKTVNLLYDRVGPLFQGAFQAKHIATGEYLDQLINYIHLNPVESGLVEDPKDWPYSSYGLLNDRGDLPALPRLLWCVL